MRLLIAGFLAMLSLTAAPLAAQQRSDSGAETSISELPQWLIDFSNIPKETQQRYIEVFREAKIAYASGNWVLCCTYLNECEFIFKGNPHVWNLRATCLIEQANFHEAELMLKKAQQELPMDETTIMNRANLHMARGEFAECIELLRAIIDAQDATAAPDLTDVLTFRIYLCHLMLGQQKEAAELVRHLGPLDDTPLYYFSQAALHISKGNRTRAVEDINAASAIFSKGNAIQPYIRSIQASGLENKFLPSGS